MSEQEKEELAEKFLNAIKSAIYENDKESSEETTKEEKTSDCECCKCNETELHNTLHYNIIESETEVVFIVNVAGEPKENIKVETKKNIIKVSTKCHPYDDNLIFDCMGFDNNNAEVYIDFPKEMIDTDKIVSRYENGTVIITCPKAKTWFAREIKID